GLIDGFKDHLITEHLVVIAQNRISDNILVCLEEMRMNVVSTKSLKWFKRKKSLIYFMIFERIVQLGEVYFVKAGSSIINIVDVATNMVSSIAI
ncbi:hypothetical protein HAX54_039023, partial [Datura stramonium]|nr:hypothetical protein [Datura stramonium]